MSEPWGPEPGLLPEAPPFATTPPDEHHHGRDHRDHDEVVHVVHEDRGYAGSGYRAGYGGSSLLREQVRTQFGRGISVADLLSWLDLRVTEMHAALLEGERHPSRVPGSPVRMSGLDAVLNTDATAFRTLTELGGRLDRLEEKVDRLLEQRPER